MKEEPTPTKQPPGARLLFLSGLFGVLLNFPLLAAFDHGERVAGVPALYWYVLLTWALLIGLAGWLVRPTN